MKHRTTDHEKRWSALPADAAELGYRVLLVEYVESPECPGILGMAEGAIVYSRRRIRIRECLSIEAKVMTLEHELDHARDPEGGVEIDAEYRRRRLIVTG